MNVVLGMCLFELDDFANAKAAFRKAQNDERSESNARQWLLYIESEEERIDRLQRSLAELREADG